MAERPRLGAIAAVTNCSAMLLVRRRNPPDAGLWGLPGGHVEPGETALRAAVREVAEETGIRVRALGYLTNIDVIRHGPDGTLETHYLLAVVRCSWISGSPIAADDVSEAAWVPFEVVVSRALPMSERVDEVLALARAAGG